MLKVSIAKEYNHSNYCAEPSWKFSRNGESVFQSQTNHLIFFPSELIILETKIN